MASAFEERLDRARSIDPDHWIIETDPTIVRIKSESSNTEYTVVPNVGYCSCEDRQYRQVPCKHVLYLAVSDTAVSEEARCGIEHHRDVLNEEMEELQDRLAETRDRARAWTEAAYQLDPDTDWGEDAITAWIESLDTSDVGYVDDPDRRTNDDVSRIASTVNR